MHKGFDGLFRGLGDLLQIASDLAERTERGERTERAGEGGVFGLSMRVNHGPVVSHTGPLHSRARHTPDDPRSAVVDVFDEDDHYLVVAEMPGAAETAIRWSVRDDEVLLIRADIDGRNYARETRFTSRVDAGTAVARFGNGVLELRIWKRQPR
jgi:HSP20 family protein